MDVDLNGGTGCWYREKGHISYRIMSKETVRSVTSEDQAPKRDTQLPHHFVLNSDSRIQDYLWPVVSTAPLLAATPYFSYASSRIRSCQQIPVPSIRLLFGLQIRSIAYKHRS